MTENPHTEPVPAGEDWFENWLDTGAVAQRSVPIYARPDLFARYEDLDRKLDVAKTVEQAAGGERAAGESSEVSKIEDQMQQLYDQWQASKATWFIRALTATEIDEVRDECGFPDDLPDNSTDEQRNAYVDAYTLADAKANTHLIARALVKVEDPHGNVVKQSITPAGVAQIRKRLGDVQILRLVAAAQVAMTEDVEIPVPFRSRATGDEA
mgnify:FL=1